MVVIVTHDSAVAELADTRYKLRDGVLVDDAPQRSKASPK
jgi:ABC-type lipoprotein export system ATPase subunit